MLEYADSRQYENRSYGQFIVAERFDLTESREKKLFEVLIGNGENDK